MLWEKYPLPFCMTCFILKTSRHQRVESHARRMEFDSLMARYSLVRYVKVYKLFIIYLFFYFLVSYILFIGTRNSVDTRKEGCCLNSFNHLLIGTYLYHYLNKNYGISLRKTSFLYGCVCPDFWPSVVLNPHYTKNHVFRLQQIVTKLSLERRTRMDLHRKRFSLQLGILCHYYSDFFCYAHNKHFSGTSAQHVSYECKLHKYFKEHINQLHATKLVPDDRTLTSISGIHHHIADMHRQYIHSAPHPELDMVYSIKASAQILFSILNASLVSGPLNTFHPRTV